jgi:hypothetical protein
MTRGQFAGFVLAVIQALAVTWLVFASVTDLGPNDWQGWAVIEPLTVLAAWLTAFAWWRRLRVLAVPAALLTLLAPWGFIYFGPMLAVGLAIAGVFLRPQPVDDGETAATMILRAGLAVLLATLALAASLQMTPGCRGWRVWKARQEARFVHLNLVERPVACIEF